MLAGAPRVANSDRLVTCSGGDSRSRSPSKASTHGRGFEQRHLARLAKRSQNRPSTRENVVKMTTGGDDGVRTHDLRLAKPALYQLSYIPLVFLFYKLAELTGVARKRVPTLVKMKSQMMMSATKMASGKATSAVVQWCRVSMVKPAFKVPVR